MHPSMFTWAVHVHRCVHGCACMHMRMWMCTAHPYPSQCTRMHDTLTQVHSAHGACLHVHTQPCSWRPELHSHGAAVRRVDEAAGEGAPHEAASHRPGGRRAGQHPQVRRGRRRRGGPGEAVSLSQRETPMSGEDSRTLLASWPPARVSMHLHRLLPEGTRLTLLPAPQGLGGTDLEARAVG